MVENKLLHVILSTLSSVFEYPDETLSLVFDILSLRYTWWPVSVSFLGRLDLRTSMLKHVYSINLKRYINRQCLTVICPVA